MAKDGKETGEDRIARLDEEANALMRDLERKMEPRRASRLCMEIHSKGKTFFAGYDDTDDACIVEEKALTPAQQRTRERCDFLPIETDCDGMLACELDDAEHIFEGIGEHTAEDTQVRLTVKTKKGQTHIVVDESELLAALPQTPTAIEHVSLSPSGIGGDTQKAQMFAFAIKDRGGKNLAILLAPSHDTVGDSSRPSYTIFLKELIEGLVKRDVTKGEAGRGYLGVVLDVVGSGSMVDTVIAKVADGVLTSDPVQGTADVFADVKEWLNEAAGGMPDGTPGDVVALRRSKLTPDLSKVPLEKLILCVKRMIERS